MVSQTHLVVLITFSEEICILLIRNFRWPELCERSFSNFLSSNSWESRLNSPVPGQSKDKATLFLVGL